MTKNSFDFEPSDCKTMQLWEKGQILALSHAKKTVQEIAEICTRSCSWVNNIIGALKGSDVETELINIWEAKNADGQVQESQQSKLTKYARKVRDGGETKRQHDRRVVYGNKRKPGKGTNFGTVEGGTSGIRHKHKEHNDRGANRSRPLAAQEHSGKSETVVNKVRKSKDYIGE